MLLENNLWALLVTRRSLPLLNHSLHCTAMMCVGLRRAALQQILPIVPLLPDADTANRTAFLQPAASRDLKVRVASARSPDLFTDCSSDAHLLIVRPFALLLGTRRVRALIQAQGPIALIDTRTYRFAAHILLLNCFLQILEPKLSENWRKNITSLRRQTSAVRLHSTSMQMSAYETR